MRFSDGLYFAPNVRFADVHVGFEKLPQLWSLRINGFYLEPARACILAQHGFAAGLLCVGAIDAMARVECAPSTGVAQRFIRFAMNELPSFSREAAATALYQHFRNGLVHEARLKLASEFSLDAPDTFAKTGETFVVNPSRLVEEVAEALSLVIQRAGFTESLTELIRVDFARELEGPTS